MKSEREDNELVNRHAYPKMNLSPRKATRRGFERLGSKVKPKSNIISSRFNKTNLMIIEQMNLKLILIQGLQEN